MSARDQQIQSLTEQRREVGMDTTRLPNEQALLEIASEPLAIALAVAQSAQRWAERRVLFARDHLESSKPTRVMLVELVDAEQAFESVRERRTAVDQKIIEA